MKTMNKAWQTYFDRNELGKVSSRELGIARLAFAAGWEAHQTNIEPLVSVYEKYYVIDDEDPQLDRE